MARASRRPRRVTDRVLGDVFYRAQVYESCPLCAHRLREEYRAATTDQERERILAEDDRIRFTERAKLAAHMVAEHSWKQQEN